jgi:hypothetical protein
MLASDRPDMAARRKTLEQLVRDRSFLARRHADRLLETPVQRADLRALQESYRNEGDIEVRKAIAFAFERAVHKSPSQELPFAAVMYSIAGPDAGDHDQLDKLGLRSRDGTIDWSAYEKLQRRWKWWAGHYGPLWRFKHGGQGHADDVDLYRRLSGDRRNKRADVAHEWLDAHREQVDALIASREPIPDPPTGAQTRPIDDVLASL